MSVKLLTTAVLAHLLDISERRVQVLSKTGVISRASRGHYELVSSVRGYIGYLRDRNDNEGNESPDLQAERARLTKAKADMAEMDAELQHGNTLLADDVAAAWIEVVSLMRTRLLALPDKMAPVINETTSIAQAKDVIKKALHEVLAEIAATRIEIVHRGGGDGGPEEDTGAGSQDSGSAA